MITIYDIAKAAGVSPTTVSRVINDYSDVSEKTRKKVLEVMDKMDYIPSPSARSLSTKRSNLVGVLFSETLNIGIEHPFFAGVIENFKKRMELEGYDTLFVTTSLKNKELSYLQHCKYRQLDGVFVVTGDINEGKLVELLTSNIKCVTTDMDYPGIPRICSDNATGSSLVVEYYISEGYEEIAYISGPLPYMASKERYDGFLETYTELKGDYDFNYFEEANDFCMEEGYKAAQRLYTRLGRHKFPKCMYVGGDTMALGAMNYLREQGIKIPEDVKVVGFDDIEVAKQVSPRLSTIVQDRQKIGTTIAEALLNLIEGKKVPPVQLVPVDIILRETT